MARRLTTFSKLLITLAIVAAAYFGAMYLKDNVFNKENTEQNNGSANEGSNSNSGTVGNSTRPENDDVVRIGVVTWGGYAGGQYFNEGFEATKDSRFYKDYGFQVEFKVLDNFDASRNAFKNGDIDLLWATIDAFPTEVDGLKAYDPVVVFQADWSRGGDAIIARRGISKVADLKGKTIAVAEMTPSHSFLIWLMEAGGLSVKDVKILGQADAVDAAKVFRAGRSDAAVVWSPDDILSLKAVPGSRVLENSKSAAYIIADIFYARNLPA